jgi:hypothetical protein
MLERHVEAYLVKAVRERGGEAYKFTSPAMRGVADRLVVMPSGVVWFVELKRPGGKRTPLQERFALRMEDLGQRYALLCSIEEVRQWLLTITK